MIGGDDMDKVAELTKSGLLAAFGGLVGHLVDVVHRKTAFTWFGFLVAILVAFLVGQALGGWIPENFRGRDGLLMVSGTSAYPILVALQDKLLAMLKKADEKL